MRRELLYGSGGGGGGGGGGVGGGWGGGGGGGGVGGWGQTSGYGLGALGFRIFCLRAVSARFCLGPAKQTAKPGRNVRNPSLALETTEASLGKACCKLLG